MNKYNRATVILSCLFVTFLFLPMKTSNASFPSGLVQNKNKAVQKIKKAEQWADGILSKMTEEEILGQLFMVAAYSNRDATHVNELKQLIKEHHIGGLIFFQGGPIRQAQLTNQYQALSKYPLMIAMDAEWGLGMRLDSTMNFPKQMTLGAIQDNTLIYSLGKEIARQCTRLGMQLNFAPVVDINVNPKNPIIGVRSFGENKELVAEKGIAYMKGMQDNGVLANAKHFPGHGDTDVDSHLGLPVITHDQKRLETIEQYPFKKLMEAGLSSIMVAHIYMPAYEKEENVATTLSPKVVTELLKNKLGFKGLIFTDALNMKGVAKYYEPGEVDEKALLAGNDVLLFAENVPLAVQKIKKAIKKKKISIEEIKRRVKKILVAKHLTGLHQIKPIKLKNLHRDLNTKKANLLNEKLYRSSLTVVKNESNTLPIKDIDPNSIAIVHIGNGSTSTFDQYTHKYIDAPSFIYPEDISKNELNALLQKLKSFETVLVNLHKTKTRRRSTMRFSDSTIYAVKQISQEKKTILSIFANPYTLKDFGHLPHIILAHVSNEITQKYIPQLIFGGIGAIGKLPVTVHPQLPAGTGITVKKNGRLSFLPVDERYFNTANLYKIDSIMNDGILDTAFPGGQIFIARHGNIIYNKNYGSHTYENKIPVSDKSIFDIASVTKVAATMQAIMFLQERGEIDINKKLSYYLKELKGTNKENLIIRDILTHQAGLRSFLPHWVKTVDNGRLKKSYYCRKVGDSIYCEHVSQDIYGIKSLEDSLWQWTVDSRLLRKRRRQYKYKYRYSDLGFYMMKRLAEHLLNQPIEDFVRQNYYLPLGMTHTLYNPLDEIPFHHLVPTEWDTLFRKELIQGTVHDQGAAMMGGVGGHAGLFSNSYELGILMQMLLQKGFYGGRRYFSPKTIEYFTSRPYSDNRRGLGFDKPERKTGGPTSNLASQLTFGHSGFTGIGAWCDPKYELVFIFVSNRIHPNAENRKLISKNIRTKIHDIIYQSLPDYKL